MNQKKVKLFQICFEERQFQTVESPFIVFDNTSNEKPELREFHNFKRIIEEGHADDCDLWGAFGQRWQGKLRYRGDDILSTIHENADYDVYLFNHARIQSALTYNVWDQGEVFHPGIVKVARAALEKMEYDPDVTNVMMTDENTCYCSYFVATKEFWNDYFSFLEQLKSTLESLSGEEKQIYEGSANYSRDAELNMFPFIVERMFSTFLLLKKSKYKTYSKQYDYSVYNELSQTTMTVLENLNKMKTLTQIYSSRQIFECWNAMRFAYLKELPQIMHLD